VVGVSRGRITQIINNTNFGEINNLLSQGRDMSYIAGHYQMDLALAWALRLEGKTDQVEVQGEKKAISWIIAEFGISGVRTIHTKTGAEFIGKSVGIAHDFNNLLTAIIGNLSLVELYTKSGGGTTFTIFLSAFEKETFRVKDIEEELIYKGKGNILFMDDKENIKNMVKHMLNHLGYEVELATDGAEAIELYKEAKASGQGFDAVIPDLTIPGGMGGMEAIGKLYEIDPEIKAIVSSGYSNDPIMNGYEANGFKGAIAKPYEIEELSNILNEVLENSI